MGKNLLIILNDNRMSISPNKGALSSYFSRLITGGLYSDGTGAGGKEIDGLEKAVPLSPELDTDYGNIDATTWAFWRNQVNIGPLGAATAANITEEWNDLWANLVRGNDSPDLIPANAGAWKLYLSSLQGQQRFSNIDMADAGFSTIKYMTADVVLDGGIYWPSRASGATGAPAGTAGYLAYFLNCDYIHYRPHSARNMVPLSPNRRYATNQDAEVAILAWAGNLTCSGRGLQGRYDPAA